MLDSRFALVSIRLLLYLTGAFYAILKVVNPEPNPIMGVSSAMAPSMDLPIDTNPAFAYVLVFCMLVLCSIGAVTTARSMILDIKRYKHLAPFSSPFSLVLMLFFSMAIFYYLVVNILVGTPIFYLLTILTVSLVLLTYEWRQYARVL